MSDPNENERNRNDAWAHENNVRFTLPRPEYIATTSAAATPANIYMYPTAQEAFVAHSNHHQFHPHSNSLHQQLQGQPLHMMPPNSFVQPQEYPPTTPAMHGDGFTVLRTPHGDFFKVYYNNDEAMNFNNYELFSKTSFAPHHAINQQHHQQQSQQQQTPSQSTQSFPNFQQMNVPQVNEPVRESSPIAPSTVDNNTNFINQLVENWMPNMSGTYTPFGESPLPPQSMPISIQNQTQSQAHRNSIPALSMNDCIAAQQQQQNHVLSQENSASMNVGNEKKPTANANVAQLQRTNGNFVQNSDANRVTGEKKTRMVAEVKPMRMSYSDVLSKNVSLNRRHSSDVNGNASNSPSNGNSTNSTNVNQSSSNGLSSSSVSQQRSSKSDKNSKANHTNVDKKTSNHDGNEKDGNGTNIGLNKSSSKVSLTSSTSQKNSSSEIDAENSKENRSIDDRNNSKGKKNNNLTKTNSGRSKVAQNESMTKRKSDIFSTSTNSKDDSMDKTNISYASNSSANSSTNNSGNGVGYFYNITKNEIPNQFERSSSGNSTSIRSSYQYRKSTSTNKSINRSTNNSRTEKSNQYQTKRAQKSRSENATYIWAQKLMKTWLNLLLRFLNWLIALVSDVVLLSFGIIWDRLMASVGYLKRTFVTLYHEMFTSSGRPSSYFSNFWRRFDQRFDKDSKWAFWRRWFVKKKPPEPTTDYYKNGRLPQTGDEAMYSLLNCKGKDAYSILGVQSDCSQEQIRKHYKKIAVLVHPDKNKQPGAEEAFKILQRAFELIGEPESRKAYDQSVAEALNAEKAWSELNDLLRQLQTKIAEAANTIRCSSCGLRHPRKPTGRPHFAARQCNMCKIRHTAREGDIWAETTFFGLRWKYLALMEGKVLDITEWANCQKGALSHLQPNSHIVQYRIVLGSQQQNQQQQAQQERERMKREQTTEPSLDDFLDNLYSGQNPQTQNASSSSRRRNRKN